MGAMESGLITGEKRDKVPKPPYRIAIVDPHQTREGMDNLTS
jgi:hypothetical protein